MVLIGAGQGIYFSVDLAPVLLAIGGTGDNYPALFLVGAAFAVLSAVTVWPIRGVR